MKATQNLIETLKENRESVIDMINDEIRYTSVKLKDVMNALAGSQNAYSEAIASVKADQWTSLEMKAVEKITKEICNNAILKGICASNVDFEIFRQEQLKRQMVAAFN